MPATDLRPTVRKRSPKIGKGTALFALLPALCLITYWMFGENGLIVITLGLPVLFVFYSGTYENDTQEKRDIPLPANVPDEQIEAKLTNILHSIMPDERLTPFCMEIDNAKNVARRLGDAQLRDIQNRITSRLSSNLRSVDTVCQSGPLQWILMTKPDRNSSLDAAIQQATRLQDAFEDPFSITSDSLYVTGCIGFTIVQLPCKDARDVIAQGRNALGHAILSGPNSVRAFSANAKTRSSNFDIASFEDLNGDIDSSLVAWFQPQISTDTGQISGFEALARWKDNAGQWHAPAAFLPIIAKAGQMERLTDTILSQSLKALCHWDEAQLNIETIGVNFSESDLANPRLYEKIAWDLDRFGIAPHRLCVEVLESVIAGEADDVIVRNVTRLANLGCQIDLDDFGTGHASISTLRRLPVNRLKIYRSFVAKADLDSEQQKMVATILMMADRLELSCLAEGVETLGEQSILA